MMQEQLPVIANFEVRQRAYLAPDGAIPVIFQILPLTKI
jgi:hypothetical protein